MSPTFENTALTDNNFVIKEMECWALSDMEVNQKKKFFLNKIKNLGFLKNLALLFCFNKA